MGSELEGGFMKNNIMLFLKILSQVSGFLFILWIGLKEGQISSCLLV
jgi:hypothetical protein